MIEVYFEFNFNFNLSSKRNDNRIKRINIIRNIFTHFNNSKLFIGYFSMYSLAYVSRKKRRRRRRKKKKKA